MKVWHYGMCWNILLIRAQLFWLNIWNYTTFRLLPYIEQIALRKIHSRGKPSISSTDLEGRSLLFQACGICIFQISVAPDFRFSISFFPGTLNGSASPLGLNGVSVETMCSLDFTQGKLQVIDIPPIMWQKLLFSDILFFPPFPSSLKAIYVKRS
jgi:hypothetical protein